MKGLKIKIMDPEHGDKERTLKPRAAAQLILEKRRKGEVNFVKFSDETKLDLPRVPKIYTSAQIQDMMVRTGILQQIEEKDQLGVDATLVPAVGGG